MKRVGKTQEERNKIHKARCCTTRWWCVGIVIFSIGLIMLIASVGVYVAEDLASYVDADYSDNCYVESLDIDDCTTECNDCEIYTYLLTPLEQLNCATDECDTFPNGCVGISYYTSCDNHDDAPFDAVEGDAIGCYTWKDGGSCSGNVKIDPDNEWESQYTTFAGLIAVSVIIIVISFFICAFGTFRCYRTKIYGHDDEENGTGCYNCLDYDRCCWGESAGHALFAEQNKFHTDDAELTTQQERTNNVDDDDEIR